MRRTSYWAVIAFLCTVFVYPSVVFAGLVAIAFASASALTTALGIANPDRPLMRGLAS